MCRNLIPYNQNKSENNNKILLNENQLKLHSTISDTILKYQIFMTSEVAFSLFFLI